MRKCFLAVILFLVAVASGGFYLFVVKDLPTVQQLRTGKPPVTYIYAADGVLIGQLSSLPGRYVDIKEMPEHLIKAVVATEDSRFFRHKGIDYVAIVRAAVKDILHGRFKEGGSTITQQLAKILYLSKEKTIIRKLKEAIIAIKLERHLSKEEILELYLNRAYFGGGAYGVEDASRLYFGKSVKKLNIKEAALLAGLLKAPNLYSPFKNLRRAEQRVAIVLKRMEEEGYLRPSERKAAESIKLNYKTEARDDIYGYFLDMVREYLEEKYGHDAIYKDGLKVYTTLRRWAQISATRALRRGLERVDKLKGWRGPIAHRNDLDVQKELGSLMSGESLKQFKGRRLKATVLRVYPDKAILKVNGAYAQLKKKDALWARKVVKNRKVKYLKRFSLQKVLSPGDIVLVKVKGVREGIAYVSLEQTPLVEGALVAVEPATGFIQALVGGYSYRKSQFNRALYAKRQAGSVFKPFVYALAFDKGLTPATVFKDEPVEYPKGDGGYWRPMNYDRKYHGRVNLREALVQSLNIPTVKVAEQIGLSELISFTKRIGFSDIPEDLSLSLGSVVVTPLEVARAYTVFPNYGRLVEPIFIKKIVNSKGEMVEIGTASSRMIISDGVAFLITDILREAIKRGTGKEASGLSVATAGKTGTTDNFRDAWFAGYTPNLLAVVWIGYDNGASIGRGMSGGRIAAPVWKEFMSALIKTDEKKEFRRPESVVVYYVDRKTGLRVIIPSKSSYREYFIKGKEPEFKTLKKIKEFLKSIL
jgi:penicillin-binding protein 1A